MDILDRLSELPTQSTATAAASLETIISRARATGIPTALTENGEPVAAVLSWELFEELEAAVAALRHVEHQREGCRFGPVEPPPGADCGCRTTVELESEGPYAS
ncbi:type II toxin-antitoxin system prevent-host-death family antitoxin [Streptomyces sp. NPDC050610]|uniref:type II toxin-antitoxin system prevent-host-death family antitoxin n=1 Tax=Streptomyces sp. NPDC050610 TaxID=3157097 RepID=UPI0034368DB9